MASSKDFPFIQKLNIPLVAKKQILTASGKQALGKYSKGMIEFVENPKASTVPRLGPRLYGYYDEQETEESYQRSCRFAGSSKKSAYKNINAKGRLKIRLQKKPSDMIKKTGKTASPKLK